MLGHRQEEMESDARRASRQLTLKGPQMLSGSVCFAFAMARVKTVAPSSLRLPPTDLQLKVGDPGDNPSDLSRFRGASLVRVCIAAAVRSFRARRKAPQPPHSGSLHCSNQISGRKILEERELWLETFITSSSLHPSLNNPEHGWTNYSQMTRI